MAIRYPRLYRVVQNLHGVLSKTETRLGLSVLILLSLLPFDWVFQLWWVFFLIFGVEFAARVMLIRFGRVDGEGTSSRLETVMLLVDLVALLSFLPLQELESARYLRLLRFTRLIILFGYWGTMFRNLLVLTTRRERSRQLLFLGFCVLGLTFISGSVLHEMDTSLVQRELGLTAKPTFPELMWWSFRQIEDPGNLVADSNSLAIWVISLLLTIAGLFLFSFLIGIGTTVVEELVTMSREQSIGMRQHSVLLNAGANASFFVDQVVEHYLKQVKRPRWMIMGPDLHAEFMTNPRYRRIHYRRGTPYHPADLAKIDAAHARRIIVLASDLPDDPDAETVSAVLSSRQCNPNALIFAEIIDDKNAPAALAAGSMHNTIVVPTEHMLALVTANILLRPAAFPVIEELLTASGNEIYTYLYHLSQRPDARPLGDSAYYDRLVWEAWRRHRCLLIGVGTPPDDGMAAAENGTDFHLNPTHAARGFPANAPIRGFVTVATTFNQARHVAEDMDDILVNSGEAPPDVLDLRLVPEGGEALTRVLVCGFRPRTAILLEHFIEFNPQAQAWIMLRTEADLRRARAALLSSGISENQFADPDIYLTSRRGSFVEMGDGWFSYRDASGQQTSARIHLLQADWTSRQDLLSEHGRGFDLASIDKMVIQSQDVADGDPDALAVLTVMKLHNLWLSKNYRHRMNPRLHVVVEMVDPLKTRLLENSFGDSVDSLPFTVVPVERIRNVMMFYSTVVPGFCPVVREIFDRRDQVFHYCRLEGVAPDDARRVPFDQLLWTLYQRHGVMLLAIRLEHAVDGQHIFSLSQAKENPSFTLGDIAGFYVIGEDHVPAVSMKPTTAPAADRATSPPPASTEE